MIHIDQENRICQIKVSDAEQLIDDISHVLAISIGNSYEDLFDEEKRSILVANVVIDIGEKTMDMLENTVRQVIEKHEQTTYS